MKITSLPGALLVALVFSTAGQTADARSHSYPKSGLQAKIQYCKGCHGASGRGYRGSHPIPQLAGQQVQYLENQFVALSEHRRDNPVAKRFMVPVIASVSPSMRKSIAEYFSGLHARASGGGPKKLVPLGKKIFEEGIPDENVPACSACHGADARGNDMVPRLAGQMYPYIVAQLQGWGKGYRSKDPVSESDENTMKAIANSMKKEQMAAVAAYLSRLD